MTVTQLNKFFLITFVTILLFPLNIKAKDKDAKHFGKNSAFLIDDLPPGKIKSKLKALHGKKHRKAMKQLHSFSFREHDLKHMEIDDQGDVLFADSFEMTELIDPLDESTGQVIAFSVTDTFKLHSKPGASNIIYIDVNGHKISGTAWNGSTSIFQARAFDTDGNAATFSDVELTQITEIWHRVAEDFAPFDIDVTTEEPLHFGPTTGRILITYNKDASGIDMPQTTAGGTAYTNVWGRGNYANFYSPALVYYNNLASFPPYIAEAASHEMGHNLGLSHNGTSTKSYYTGHGNGFVSWAPIMGVGHYSNVTQWSKGEYTDASKTQDHISILSNLLSFRTDDHGNNIYTPTPLLVDALGMITVSSTETDPHNLSPENKGIIETHNDIDFFTFAAGNGPLDIVVTPAWDSFYRSSLRGSNLDIQVSLYNWDGQLITSSDPLDETDAQIITTVTSGHYLLAIEGVGNTVSPYSDYGSLGQYFISGKVAPFTLDTDSTPPTPNPMGWTVAPYSQSRTSISMQASTAIDASGLVQYNFICLSGSGCSNSSWQTSKQYTATGLQAGSSYSFQVIARDAYANETNPSSIASASTVANNAPQTINHSVSTREDTRVIINLAAQSSDADSDQLSFSIKSQSKHGISVNHNNGTVSYTPANNFNGIDSFNYLVNDGFGGIASGTISITVTAVNDLPVASVSVSNTSALNVTFSSVGSYDPDSTDTLSFWWDFGDGSSSNAANPSHSYSTAGSYTVLLTVRDNLSSNTKTVTITVVNPTNHPPQRITDLFASVSHSSISGNTVVLSWSPSYSATKYNIWRCQVVTSSTRCNGSTLFTTTSGTSFITPLTTSTTYYWVYAENIYGKSIYSNIVKVIP